VVAVYVSSCSILAACRGVGKQTQVRVSDCSGCVARCPAAAAAAASAATAAAAFYTHINSYEILSLEVTYACICLQMLCKALASSQQ
jgi:hypothetical protein